MSIRLVPLAAAAILAACGSGAIAGAAQACDRYASPDGSDRAAGTLDQPLRSVQRLADTLRPGQTGCLREGVYDDETDGGYVLKFFHGGRKKAPIHVRGYPGERAKLKGVVYFPESSPHVRLTHVEIDGRAPWLDDETVTVQLMARDIVFEANTVTNDGLKSCMILGSNSGWGRSVNARIRRNVFHDCGNRAHGLLDHSIYVENARRTLITDNVFHNTAGYAVHLYPNAQRSRVVRNVMLDNGGGVIFAGWGRYASSRNLVARNVISGTRGDYAIAHSWGDRLGRANVARDNCLSRSVHGKTVEDALGFTARANVDRAPSSCAETVGAAVAARATRLYRR